MRDDKGVPSRRWARVALWLVGGTLFYNVAEAVVALWSGAEAESIALLGFGLDSLIECAAAAVLLWRLLYETRGGSREILERLDRRAHRFVGATFIALAVYVLVQASVALWRQEPPRASTVGIVLALASLVIMPILSLLKLKASRQIGSAALRAEAKETLACSYLSFTLLLGLSANALFGWWWADPLAALLMLPWLIKEGLEGLRGECCGECEPS